jgi:hypothetical protein
MALGISDTHKDWRQPPYLQFFAGKLVFSTLGAIILLVLTKVLLFRECFKAVVQIDGL